MYCLWQRDGLRCGMLTLIEVRNTGQVLYRMWETLRYEIQQVCMF